MSRPVRSLGPSYRRLWLAATISNVGDGVFFTALPLLAVTLTRDPLQLSAVTFSLTLPWLLFALLSGALVDRWDRITVMWRVDLFRFVATAALAVVIFVDELSIPLLATFGFALGSAETLFDTASLSAVPSIVGTGPEQLTRANARLDSATLVANGFVGPAAGARMFIIAPALPALANAMSFVASAALLRQLPPQPRTAQHAPDSLTAEIREGLAWLRRQPLIATLAIAVGLINLCTAAAFTVLVLYLQDRAGVGSTGYSLILIAAGTGGVLGNVIAETVANNARTKRVLPGMIALTAIGLLTVGSSTIPVVISGAFLLIGLAGAIWNVHTVSLRQRIIPSELLGRVNSVYRLVAYGTLPIGAIGGGLLARLAGLNAPFLAGGTVLLVAAALLASRLSNTEPLAATGELIGSVAAYVPERGCRNVECVMTDFDFSDYYYEADSFAAGGDVQLEFVNDPALVGEDVEWTFRTVGGGTASAGTVVAQVAVMSHDHNILGGGKISIRNELGPHDIGASRIHPLQYTPHDGDYYFTITVGGDARHVAYRVHDHHVQAP